MLSINKEGDRLAPCDKNKGPERGRQGEVLARIQEAGDQPFSNRRAAQADETDGAHGSVSSNHPAGQETLLDGLW
jgi:hypothetical protein